MLGEHFVISGAPALAFPLSDIWCEVKISPSEHAHYVAHVPGDEDRETIENFMPRATYAVIDALRMDPGSQSFKVESTSNFPVSRGLGSSASFAVALARAFDSYRKLIINENADWDELVKATTAVEKVFHGSPSGVDAATILSNRPIRFEKGVVLRELTNNAIDIVVVDSGSRDNCSNLVKQVIGFRERNPEQWQGMAQAVIGLADTCEKALAAGDAVTVGKVVHESHAILSELGLSNSTIETIISEAVSRGALAGKISGAGGGGAVLLVAKKGEGRALAAVMGDAGWRVVATDSAVGGSRD